MKNREIKYMNLPGAVLLAARKEKGIANNKAIPVAAKPIAMVSTMSLKIRSVNHDQSFYANLPFCQTRDNWFEIY